jgi:glycosyltransferase involved in cell wall biosynthesis
MKILVVAPTPFFSNRGTHIRILEEALALEKMGHEITIATYHIGEEIKDKVETKIDVRRIRRWLFWYKKIEAGPDWQKILLDLMLIRKVFSLARKNRPQIIHSHLHEGVLIGWIVKKLLFWRKMKLVSDLHGSLTNEMVSHNYLKGGLLKNIFQWLERFINSLGDAIITSSDENTKEIMKYLPGRKIETVLDGVNLDYFASLEKKDDLRKKYDLPQDKMIVTYTGALIGNKGMAYLLDAIKHVLEKRKDIYFLIAGYPGEKMKDFIQNNGFHDFIRLVSPLTYFELPNLLKASDVGIDPKDSGTRQASGKILQYMGAGLPVICFRRPNNHRYLGNLGSYVENIAHVDLAEKIIEVADNIHEHARIGDEIKKLSEQFSWMCAAEKINLIYEEITD